MSLKRAEQANWPLIPRAFCFSILIKQNGIAGASQAQEIKLKESFRQKLPRRRNARRRCLKARENFTLDEAEYLKNAPWPV